MATIEEMFAQYLQREAEKDAAAQKAVEDAAKAEAESKFVTKADLEGAFSAFGEQLAAKIGEEVAKAMPVARPEGAGRQGEQNAPQEDPFEANPVEHVAQKALSELTQQEKAFIWEMTKRAMHPEQMAVGA